MDYGNKYVSLAGRIALKNFVLNLVSSFYLSYMNMLRASIIETLNLEILNGSHMDTSLFYNFLIIVRNRYSITPIETL